MIGALSPGYNGALYEQLSLGTRQRAGFSMMIGNVRGIAAVYVSLLGAIQALLKADGGGGGVSKFPEKSVTKV